jgi:hypothetical protein
MSTATSLLLYRKLLDGLLDRHESYHAESDRPHSLRVTDYQWLVETIWELTEADPGFREILAELKPRQCEGCSLTFTPRHRPEQKYHDAYCRARANTRKTYYRKRGEK